MPDIITYKEEDNQNDKKISNNYEYPKIADGSQKNLNGKKNLKNIPYTPSPYSASPLSNKISKAYSVKSHLASNLGSN